MRPVQMVLERDLAVGTRIDSNVRMHFPLWVKLRELSMSKYLLGYAESGHYSIQSACLKLPKTLLVHRGESRSPLDHFVGAVNQRRRHWMAPWPFESYSAQRTFLPVPQEQQSLHFCRIAKSREVRGGQRKFVVRAAKSPRNIAQSWAFHEPRCSITCKS